VSPISGKPVLVTGATGFIGSHLVRRLVREGAEVHCLVRPGSNAERIADVAVKCRTWTGDLRDRDSLARAVADARPEIVFHLAGVTAGRKPGNEFEQIERALEGNLKGTLNLLEAVGRAGVTLDRFVATGGLEEYGAGASPYDEAQREAPVSPYSASQTATTHLLQMLQRRLHLSIVTLRPALVYGPAQSVDFLIPALIVRCLEGGDFEMTEGQQRRDLLYVEDLAEAYLRVAVAPRVAGEVINVGTGVAVLVREIAATVVRLAGRNTRLRTGVIPERATEIADLVCSNDKAARLLGWRPTTSLEEGLVRTIAWYREHDAGDSLHVRTIR
jgi:nucleoside-diphosphate-sugar epimerase